MRIIVKIETDIIKKLVYHPKLSITYPPTTSPSTDPEEKSEK